MDAPAAFLAVRLLIHDTFSQARASGIWWLMLAVNGLCIALCLSVRIEGDVPLEAGSKADHPELMPRSDVAHASAAVAGLVAGGVSWSNGVWAVPGLFVSPQYRQLTVAMRHGVPVARGRLTLAFGAIPVDISRDRHHTVRALESVLAGWVADSVGLVLALMWTAGFLPTFLEPAAASVLLAKPMPRWSLLTGKYLGGLVFVTYQGFVFVGGTWLALALRTGVWDPTWFLCLPIMVLHFSIFYSFSALLAVTTRSTVACVFGSILFWLVCWGMNFARHAALLAPELQGLRSLTILSEVGYLVLPKPLDFHLILAQALQAEQFSARIIDVGLLSERGAWSPGASLLTSALAGVVLLGLAVYEFIFTDY